MIIIPFNCGCGLLKAHIVKTSKWCPIYICDSVIWNKEMFLYTEESGELAKRIILDYVKIKMIRHLLFSANIHTWWHCKISSPILIYGIILKCWIKLGASTYTYMVQEAEALRSQTPRYHFKSNPKPLKTQKDKDWSSDSLKQPHYYQFKAQTENMTWLTFNL